MRRLEYVITEACTVVQALRRLGYSAGQLTRLRKELGRMRINEIPVTMRKILAAGDVLAVEIWDTPPPAVPAKDIPLNAVYEDDDVLVLDKQAGLATVPSIAHYDKSLFSALKYRWGDSVTPHVVTRLDRDTTGLMLIAKNSFAHSALQTGPEIRKRYTALVAGRITGEGEICAPIRRCASGMKREVGEGGKPARTLYRAVRYFEEEDLTETELTLITGRTHQIRVHMAHIGHPLAGDALYGGPERDSIALHSSYLCFTHPVTEKVMEWNSPAAF